MTFTTEIKTQDQPGGLARLWAKLKSILSRSSDHQISRAAMLVYAIRLGSAFLAYAVQVILARFLGGNGYGVFALSWMLATVLGQLAAAGFNETSHRFLPSYIAKENMPKARGFFAFTQYFTLSIAIITALIAIAAIYFAGPIIQPAYFIPCLIAAACIPFATWTHVLESLAVSRSHVVSGLFPTYILRPVLLIGGIGLTWAFLTRQASPSLAVCVLLAAFIVTAILQTGLVKPRIARELGTGPREIDALFWIKSSLPLILSQGFLILATNIDVLMLGILTTPKDVGIYFAAAKSVAVISFIYIAVGNAMTRRLSETRATGEHDAFISHFRRARRWMFWPTLALGSAMVIAAPLLLRVFGPEFVVATPIVGVLMAGAFSQAIAGPLQETLIVCGKQNQVAITAFAAMLVNICLNVVLVLQFGIIGAAVASVTATLFRIGSLHWLANRKFRLFDAP